MNANTKTKATELAKVTVGEKIGENKILPWVIIALMAAIFTIANQMFITVAGTVPTGVMSIAVLLSYAYEGLSNYTSIMYLVLNLPLLIIFWKKSKPRWIRKTAFFIVLQASFGALFLIDGVSDTLKHSFFIAHAADSIDSFRTEIWPILLLASIGAAFGGIAMAITWKYGGSTGGTDIIVNYLSNTKNKSVGGLSRIFSISVGFVSYIIIIIINPSGQRELWLPILIGTLLYIVIATSMIDKIYPKYSKVKLDIYSDKIMDINKKFKDDKYWHAWNLVPYVSGLRENDRHMISTTIFLVELREILRMIAKVDDHAWVSVINIKASYGNFSKSYIDKK